VNGLYILVSVLLKESIVPRYLHQFVKKTVGVRKYMTAC